MGDFNSMLNWMFWSVVIVGVIQLVILIVLIIKFIGMTEDVYAMRKVLTKEVPRQDYKSDFYKWIACGDKEKAKEVLINEIGSSNEFNQLIREGNNNYKHELKKRLLNKYQSELKMIDLNLDLEIWVI